MPDYERLMLDWPLTKDSIVFDVGAFDGTWSAQIARRYHPGYMYLFEPQREGAHITRLRRAMRQAGDDGVPQSYSLLPYGLGITSGVFPMGECDTDAASFLLDSRQQGMGELMDAHKWLNGWREGGTADAIDLASINIEGYEYQLLPYLIERGDSTLFKRLAIQWHTFADPDGSMYARIFTALERTHRVLWDCWPTWQAWELR